jgi:NAD-dependent DNA ligase
MLRLELTLAEARQIQHWLTDAHQSVPESMHYLSIKLAEVLDNATQPHLCPVCQEEFVQAQRKSTGRYCSAACKQKAYRQRRLSSRKQFGPPRRS